MPSILSSVIQNDLSTFLETGNLFAQPSQLPKTQIFTSFAGTDLKDGAIVKPKANQVVKAADAPVLPTVQCRAGFKCVSRE